MSEKFFSRYGWLLSSIIFFGFLTIWCLNENGIFFKVLGAVGILEGIPVIIYFIWYSLKYKCPYCKKGNALKKGKKVAHHGTTKEKVIEYQTEEAARIYQPGHFGATGIVYHKVPTEHEYVIKDESWEYTCICCGEKTIIREKNKFKKY